MKKQYIFLCSFLIIVASLNAQNLVPNPSFETYTLCPDQMSLEIQNGGNTTTEDEVKRAPPWQITTQGTSDYYNICAPIEGGSTIYSVNVPNTIIGYQCPRTGNAYTGICTELPMYREYISAPLLSSLVAGTKYYVSMYVNLADTDVFNAMSFVPSDRIGVYISNGYPDTTGVYDPSAQCECNYIHQIPQIENPSGNLITDTLNWVQVSGWYTALGGENWITIGNFRPDLITSGYTSYYYIDDVCISTDSSNCITAGLSDCTQKSDVGIKQNLDLNNSSVYPNPIKKDGTLSFSNPKNQTCTLTLYNTQGVAVATINNITSNKVKISADNLPSGLYYYVLSAKDDVLAKGKLVVE